jgi:hypothetical protein
MCFYTNGAIQPEVAEIVARRDPVIFSEEEAARYRASAHNPGVSA